MTTIKDVARQAGVSIATVSRVINGNDNVRQTTREAVLKAVESLNYTPSALAQGLQKKQTQTIGILFPDASSYYFAEIIRGINHYVRHHGYQIVVSSSHDAEEEAETLNTLLKSRQVDGVILMMPSVHNVDSLSIYLQDVPAVLLNTEIEFPDSVTICPDNYYGAYQATMHLIEHGHTRLGILYGSPQNYDSQERYRGFTDALETSGITHRKEYEAKGDFSEHTGYQAARNILNQPERPTALFAANDAMAIGAMESAKQLGLQVPSDLAVCGFDDISTARYMSPPLTTVSVPVFHIGQTAGKQLLAELQGDSVEENPERQTIQVELVLRESCGCSDTRSRNS